MAIDDKIEDKDRYKLPHLQRLYCERLLQYDVPRLKGKEKENFQIYLSSMRQKGLVPEEFPYFELINATPDFQVRKN